MTDGKTPYNHRRRVEGKHETERKEGRKEGKDKEGTGCPQQILPTYF